MDSSERSSSTGCVLPSLDTEVSAHVPMWCSTVMLPRLLTVSTLAALAMTGVLPATMSDANWLWPMEPRNVAREFVPPPEPWSAGHRGIDIRGDQGALIIAVADGTVHFAGTIVDRGVVSIAHADGHTVTSFEPVQPLVARGDRVRTGQPIATLEGVHAGCGSCLHFGVRIDDEYRDPLNWLVLERPVLLPIDEAHLVSRPVRLADARFGRSPTACRTRRACRSAWCRGSRARAAPARREGRHRLPAGGSRRCA